MLFDIDLGLKLTPLLDIDDDHEPEPIDQEEEETF